MSHLPPEARLLFLATRPSGPDADAALSEAVKLPLNWYALFATVDSRTILGLFWEAPPTAIRQGFPPSLVF